MRKKFALLLAGVMVAASLAGCGGGSSSESSSEAGSASSESSASSETSEGSSTSEASSEDGSTGAGYKIAASHGYGAVQHWEIKTVGMQDAADDYGVEFTYKYADGDLQQEVADIENFVEMGVDYIIVGPCNSEGIVPTIEEAQSKDVVIGTCDIGIDGVDVANFVTSDNYGIGEIAAEYIGEQLGGEGQIAVLTWPSASATADRVSGFMDKLEAEYPNIEIVAEQDCDADRQTSMDATEAILQANPDVQFIFGANAEMALGALAATTSTNRTDVKVVAVDTDTEVMEGIQNGTNLVATVSQDPYTMGYKAMENAIKYLNGEEVEDEYIECELVTADNVEEIIERDNAYLS